MFEIRFVFASADVYGSDVEDDELEDGDVVSLDELLEFWILVGRTIVEAKDEAESEDGSRRGE